MNKQYSSLWDSLATPQSILALARLRAFGLCRLFTCRTAVLLYLLCFRSRFRATMTGTELLVTR